MKGDGQLQCDYAINNTDSYGQNIVLYSASYAAIENIPQGFIHFEINFSMKTEFILFLTTFIMSFIFAFLYFLGRHRDMLDNRKVKQRLNPKVRTQQNILLETCPVFSG